MMAAIPMWLLLAGTATSQTVPNLADNDQVQAGNIFAGQTLNVETASSDVTAVTTSTGNAVTGSVVTGDLQINSAQSTAGTGNATYPNQVGAQTTININTAAGDVLTSTTAATGNTLDAGISSGGTLSGAVVQSASGAPINAQSDIAGADATATNAAQSTQAIGNSAGFGATNSSINATVSQTNSAATNSNAQTVYGYVGNGGDASVDSVASFSSAAVGNNVTSTGVGNSTQTLNVTQAQSGGNIQASQFSNLANSQDSSTNATATANNFNATNEQGAFNVTTSQTNDSYVHAQGVETSYEFGGASVSSYGVGNSTFAGNSGNSISLNNTQVNGIGGVQSEASFTGTAGYDAFVASTAMGNAATGFSCASCGGGMTIHNTQTNNGDVAASAFTAINSDPVGGVAGTARSVRGTATAVGNSGTFYVTQPNP